MQIETKYKILVVIPRMPYPLNSGGRIAIYDSIRILSKKYTITLVIIDDNKENKIYVPELKKYAETVFFFGKSKIKCFINSLLFFFNRKPLQVGYFYFRDVQNLINEIYSSHNLFFSFMIRTSSYGINLNINKIHYSIDSMYLNYLKSINNTTSFFWKLIHKIELPLLFNIESEHIENYNLTTFVNKDESNFWKKYGNTITLPHGIDNTKFKSPKKNVKYKDIVSFIGRMDYQPNIDAVLWFSKNVFPYLRSNISLYIIGGFPTKEILNLRSSNIKILGFVDDPYEILSSCICTVAPMQSGGGLQTKILMAMAVNSLVLTTTLAANPIDGAINNENILIEDDPLKIANIINDISLDPIKYVEISNKGRDLVKCTYSLDVIENKLFQIVENYLK